MARQSKSILRGALQLAVVASVLGGNPVGATWDARLAQRLRYVPPKTDGPAASVASLDQYRNL